MTKSNAMRLGMLIALSALAGCSTEHVSNPNPEPYYASCETVCYAARADAPDALWRDLKNMTVTMEQLRSLQPSEERQSFGKCKCK